MTRVKRDTLNIQSDNPDHQGAAYWAAQAAGNQFGLFGAIEPPVLAAWGAGTDSTAMLIELIESGERVDQVLFADVGDEAPRTYDFIPIFTKWLEDRGVPVAIVRYEVGNYKNWPKYGTLAENCITNATLPSLAFGFGSCSKKWKIAPQDQWTSKWDKAQAIWNAGGKVIKLIGFDAGPQDSKRYADAEGYDDPRFVYRYPLRECKFDRPACEARILKAGLPLPGKSACFMCPSTKPHELLDTPPHLLRRIVLMEARAKPRLTKIEGLWRKRVLGHRGATPRPGSMTEFIRSEGLLPEAEIDRIISEAPLALLRYQDAEAAIETGNRTFFSEWLKLFDMMDENIFSEDGGAEFLQSMKSAAA